MLGSCAGVRGCGLGGIRRSKWMTRRMRKLGRNAARSLAGKSGAALKWSCTPVRPQVRTVDSISSNEASTKTPIFSSFAGRWGDDGGNLLRRDSARAGRKDKSHRIRSGSAASSASASEVLPQIFIQRLMRAIVPPCSGQQLGERCAGVGLAHQALADQEGVKAGRAQASNVGRR